MADNLKRAEEFASKARGDVASIEARIASARAVIAGAPARRSEFTLAAATGSAKANASLHKIRAEVTDAQQLIVELEEALPAARQLAADADGALREAVAAERVIELRGLAHQRIELAAEFDKCVQRLGALVEKFNELGKAALVPYADILAATGRNSSSVFSAALGDERVAGALSVVATKLYPTALIPNKFEKLESAERSFWLPTIGDATA